MRASEMAQIGVALRCFRVLLGIFTIVGCSGASAAPNIAPSDVVAQLQAALLDTMKRGEVLEFNGRYRALLPTIDDSFDLPQMTRVAVGSRWDQIMAAQRAELTQASLQFSVSSYASQFKDYGGERFEIVGENRTRALGVVVQTKLVLKDGDPVRLGYLLHRTPNGWKIVDVYFDDTISELARRRAEFGPMIQAQGVNGLIAAMKKKSDELVRD